LSTDRTGAPGLGELLGGNKNALPTRTRHLETTISESAKIELI
jgi:hypothetical protein